MQTSFRVTGRVEQVLVDLGSPVRKGQTLARLMSTDYELRVKQAEASLQQALARLGLSSASEVATVDPEKTALVHEGLRALIAREHSSRLRRLAGSDPTATVADRSRRRPKP